MLWDDSMTSKDGCRVNQVQSVDSVGAAGPVSILPVCFSNITNLSLTWLPDGWPILDLSYHEGTNVFKQITSCVSQSLILSLKSTKTKI